MFDLLFALLAGLATAASPCILPVLPILLGASVGGQGLLRPLAIVAGFVLVFSAATLAFSLTARLIGLDQHTLRTIALAMLVGLGMLMLFPRAFEFVTARLAPSLPSASHRHSNRGVLGGFVLGTSLGVVWTPCAGPVLAAILALAASADSVGASALLLVVYAIGAGAPMLAIAYGGQIATTKVRQLARYAEGLRRGFGVIVIATAALIYFEYDALFTAWLLDALSD